MSKQRKLTDTDEQEAADRVNNMTPEQFKVYEDRLRRAAKRQRLMLKKSRTRDPRATSYNGYMLVNEYNGIVVGAECGGYSMSILDIEKYLLSPED